MAWEELHVACWIGGGLLLLLSPVPVIGMFSSCYCYSSGVSVQSVVS